MEFATPSRFEELEAACDGLCVEQKVDVEALSSEEAESMVKRAQASRPLRLHVKCR